MIEASPATGARSHAATDADLPQGVNLQGDHGGQTGRASTGHILGRAHTWLATGRVLWQGFPVQARATAIWTSLLSQWQ